MVVWLRPRDGNREVVAQLLLVPETSCSSLVFGTDAPCANHGRNRHSDMVRSDLAAWSKRCDGPIPHVASNFG